jgi:hypothetical protein
MFSMLTQKRAAPAEHHALASAKLHPPEPDAILLEQLGTFRDEDHIVILGGEGPDLMCALLRAGAARVTHLCAHERPETASASLVIVPRVPSLDWLASALPAIRRLLMSDGRLVIFAGTRATAQTQIRRMLTLHGFVASRGGQVAHRNVLNAEIPTFSIRRAV